MKVVKSRISSWLLGTASVWLLAAPGCLIQSGQLSDFVSQADQLTQEMLAFLQDFSRQGLAAFLF